MVSKKRLLIVLLIVTIYLAIGVHAAGCGSTEGANPTYMDINSVATCSSPPGSAYGLYYSFYLSSKKEVEVTVTSQPEYRIRFAIDKKDEWSELPNNAKWTSDAWTLDAGYWVVLVEPIPPTWDRIPFSDVELSGFSLSVNVEESPDEPEPTTPSTYCGDDNCDSDESCSSCSSDCGICQQPTEVRYLEAGEQCWPDNTRFVCETNLWCNLYGEVTPGEPGTCCNKGEKCCPDFQIGDSISKNGVEYECGSNFYLIESGATTQESESTIAPGSMSLCEKGCTKDADCETGLRCSDIKVYSTGEIYYRCSKKGIVCCSDSGCKSGFECVDYKCVAKGVSAKEPTVTKKAVKKANGQPCYSNDECESGNCNKAGITNKLESLEGGDCCPAGKNCCADIGGIYWSGSRGDELCNDDYYLVPIKKEIEEEVIPLIEWLAPWVKSVIPENDPEGQKIKDLIHNEIYPFIVHKFDYYKSEKYGRRDVNFDINLVMTSEEAEASWDEKTATLIVPYVDNYEQKGNYKKEVVQQNAIAHELTHYHFNGIALKTKGGKYTKVPLWFREGLAEYGAHLYYKYKFSGKEGNPIMSVSEFREDRFGAYLEDERYNYKETWIENGIDKVSWKSYDDFDTDLEGYDHIYYGAVFSFVNFLADRDSEVEGKKTGDHFDYMFKEGSLGNFELYDNPQEKVYLPEKEIKMTWIETFEKEYDVDKLDNEPTNFGYKVKKFFSKLKFW